MNTIMVFENSTAEIPRTREVHWTHEPQLEEELTSEEVDALDRAILRYEKEGPVSNKEIMDLLDD